VIFLNIYGNAVQSPSTCDQKQKKQVLIQCTVHLDLFEKYLPTLHAIYFRKQKSNIVYTSEVNWSNEDWTNLPRGRHGNSWFKHGISRLRVRCCSHGTPDCPPQKQSHHMLLFYIRHCLGLRRCPRQSSTDVLPVCGCAESVRRY